MKEILFDKTHRGRALIKVLGITAITLFMLVSTAGASTFAYITNQDSNTVSVIDLVTNTVTATVNVGIRPSGVEFIPEGNVYIANTGSNNVSVIDSSTNTVIATVNVGSSPNGVAASTDRTKVYVTNYGSNTVSVIDTVANIVTATVTVGNHPFGVAVAGTKAYVTNDIDRTVSVIDTTTDTVTATISMGNKYPGGIAATETNVYVTSGANDTLSVIDTATDTVIATVPVGDKPTGIAVMGSSIYVANSGSNNISIINTGLWQTTTVSVGKSPYGVAVTPNGAEVYIANSRSNTVSVINTTTNTITATVDVGNLPKALGQFTGRQTPETDSSKIHVTRITTSGSASDPHIYGDKVVYQDNRNGNADIYIYDLSTKNETHTNNLSDQVNPAIYENNVVWEDYRNGGSDIYLQNLSTKIQTRITTSRMASGPEIYENRIPYVKYAYNGRENWHELYMYDLSTKRETQIPTMISSYQPSIYGNRIVWTDHDGFNGGDYFIYMYDVSTKTQTQIARSDDWWRTGEVVDMPDIYGNRIVWQDSRNWDIIWDIYMYDLSTQREVQISNSGTANCPAIYNNRIVWEDSFDGQNIHMYDISSSREVRITTSGSAHSPDIYGNRIVWVDGNDIYVGTLNYPVYPVADFSSNVTEGYVPLTVQFTDFSENATEWNWDFGDGDTSIEQNPVHTYSTAGTYTVNLTVSNSNGTDSKLVTIKVFTQEAKITKIASYVREWADPVWSPSGNEILFAKDDGLYKVFPDGSGEKQLVSGLISEYAWSPDGNKISYSEPEGIDEYGNRLDGERICVINADGTGKTQLLSVSGEGHYLLHNWFPSGSKILYAKCHTYSPDVDVPPEMDSTQYGIINSDGSNNQELGEIGGALSSVSLSPDASKVAHSSWGTGVRDLDQNSQDYFYLDNSYIASQTQSWQPQVWSPDSSKIAYWSYESGSSDIYTIKSDGTEKTQLTSEPGNENSPIFSPDGSKIIYVSDETGNNDILVMDADGSNNVHLTADTAADVRPVWNPDGTKIAFCSDREGDYGIYILTLKAGSDSVTNLQSTSGSNWINWTWTNPSDPDFNQTEIYLNGTLQTSTSIEHFNATGLQPETSYNISIRTVDIDGNVNPSWVNATMTTLETSMPAFPDAVEAEIYFSPSTLKLGSRGQLVTVYIELPEGYGAEGIDISSVLLNNAVLAVTDPKYNFVTDKNKYLTDIDQDGVLERMLKFDRKTVESILEAGNEVTVTFKGAVEYNNGTSSGMASFEGSDVIRVTDSKNKKG